MPLGLGLALAATAGRSLAFGLARGAGLVPPGPMTTAPPRPGSAAWALGSLISLMLPLEWYRELPWTISARAGS